MQKQHNDWEGLVPPMGKTSQGRPAGPRAEVGEGATGGQPHTSWVAWRHQPRTLSAENQDGWAGPRKVPQLHTQGW